MSTTKRFTNATGAPVADNTNIMTAGPRGPALLQDIWLMEKLAQFDREVIPERRMHAQRRQQLGFLDPAARSTAPGDHRDVRPRHPEELPPHAPLRQPHLLDDQRGE